MAIASSTSGVMAAQYGLEQLRLLQARRNAEQAEQNAQSLQGQASDARRAADRADEKARSLAVDASQARSNADRAHQGMAAYQAEGRAISRLGEIADRVVQKQQETQLKSSTQTDSATATNTAAVVNSQGQVTGRLVNTTA